MNYDFKHDDIFLIADDFYEAYIRCGEMKNPHYDEYKRYTGSVVSIPEIVNGAFALELYLKGMAAKKVKNTKRFKHSISAIFKAIDLEEQKKLREVIEPQINNWCSSFDEAVQRINNSFEYWRYIHEKSNLGFGLNNTLNVLSVFLETVKKHIKRTNEKASQ